MGITATEIREYGNGSGGDTGRQGQQQKICEMVEMVVCGSVQHVQQRPAPEKQNLRNYGQCDRMMGTVRCRDTRTLDMVAAGGDTADIQDNKGQRREDENMELCRYYGGGRAGQEDGATVEMCFFYEDGSLGGI